MVHKSALYAAVKNENVEIVQFLLSFDDIDVNVMNIYTYF